MDHLKIAIRATSVAMLSAALATSLAACGTAASTTSGTASSAPSKTAVALDKLSGDEIAQKAVANLKQASSVHLAGKTRDSGSDVTLDVTLVSGKGCEGNMTDGKGSVKVKMIGTTVWMNADGAFWIANGGSDQSILAKLVNKWIKTGKSADFGSSMSNLCDLNKLLDQKTGITKGLRKGATTTVNGQPALQLKGTADTTMVEVSNTADPRLLAITDPSRTDGGTVTFTDYNAPVNLMPPPASETVDGKSLGI